MGNLEQAISRDRLGFALRKNGPTASTRAKPCARRRVASLTRIVPGSAACCSRAAILAVSPITVWSIGSLSPIEPKITGPLWMPMRTGKFSRLPEPVSSLPSA